MKDERTCDGESHQEESLDTNMCGQRDTSEMANHQWPETPTLSNQAEENRMKREEEKNEKKLTVKKVSQILNFDQKQDRATGRSVTGVRVTKNAEKVSISRIMKASLLKANKQFQTFSRNLK